MQQETFDDFLDKKYGKKKPEPKKISSFDDFLNEKYGSAVAKKPEPELSRKKSSFGKDLVSGLKDVAGVPEAAVGLASGIPSWILSRLSIPAVAGYQAVTGGPKNIDLGKARDVADKLASYGTYQPKTKLGKTLTVVATSPFTALGEGVKWAGETAGLSKEAQAGVETALDLGLLALPWLKGGAKAYVENAIKYKKPIDTNVIKGAIESNKDVPAKVKAEIAGKIAETPETPAMASAKKIMDAIKETEKLRPEQEKLFTKERGKRLAMAIKARKRVGGEKGAFAARAELKGELPRPQLESIRGKLEEIDIKNVYDEVRNSNLLSEWERFSAEDGLIKLLGEHGARIPAPHEIIVLKRLFGKEFANVLLKRRDRWTRLMEGVYQGLNIPRAIMASYDLSAPFRQGVFFVATPEFWRAYSKMFKFYKSEKAFTAVQERIASMPDYQYMRQAGLALTEMDSLLGLREEMFMSPWAEKIPGVRASGRAYTGFLNMLRADRFTYLLNKAEKLGLNPRKTPSFGKEIASFVNAATGRGGLGKLERSAVALNSTLFSPRLTTSRLKLLNPVYYLKALASKDPNVKFVRQQALKSLFTFAGAGMTVLTLAKMRGANVGTDPRSSDFGKVKIGNTRIDIWGGFQQYVRLVAQLASKETVSATTGKVRKLGEGYKPDTQWDLIERFGAGKLSPVASFAYGLLNERSIFGEKFNIPKETVQRFVPMVIQDMIDIAKDDPDALPISLLGIFGVGLQTYGQKRKKYIGE